MAKRKPRGHLKFMVSISADGMKSLGIETSRCLKVPLPGKSDIAIEFPSNADSDDMELIYSVMASYVNRMLKLNRPIY